MTRRSTRGLDGDPLPYDRELIRSGTVSSRDARRPDPVRRSGPMPARPRRRRRGSTGRTIGLLFTLALLAITVGGVLLALRGAAFNATVTDTPFVSTALLGPLNGDRRVNVMLVGYGGEGHDGAYLADSIQLLSIDPTTDSTTTVPIPRDLWIEGVTAFARNGKVNEVFAAGQAATGEIDGAGELLADVIGDVTGLAVDHWLAIDFTGFRDMVDAVGGVTVENPTRFCWTTTEADHAAGNWDRGCFDQGTLTLDGESALMYSRARYTSVAAESTDFARSVRQARIMSAMRASLGDGGPAALLPGLRLMGAMEGRVRTDLSAIDLALLSGHLASDRRVELSEGPVLTATTNTIGQYILVPTGWTGPGDYGRIRSHLEAELARPIEQPPTDAP